jgi:uncharacterized protein (TIRG00374 family)
MAMVSRKSGMKLLFGLGLVALLLFWVDWRAGARMLLAVNPWLLLVNGFLFLLALWVAALRWRVLLRPQGLNPALGELFKVYWIGAFANNFLPSNIGGDLARVGWVRHYRDTAAILASVVAERTAGFVVLLAFAMAGAVVRPELFARGELYGAFWTLAVLMLFVLGGVLAGAAPLTRRLARGPVGGEGWRFRFTLGLKRLAEAALCYRNRPAALAGACGFSLLYYLLGFAAQYTYARALYLPLTFWEVAAVTPLIYLISLLPVSFNALGIAESACVFFYLQVGLRGEEALALAFLARFVQMVYSLVGGCFLLSGKSKPLPPDRFGGP